MAFLEIIKLLGAGLFIGFFIGLTGIGAVLVLPVLIRFFGLAESTAVGAASLYAFLARVYAVFEHARLKTIAWKISGIFLAGAIPGVLSAAIYVAAAGKKNDPGFQRHLRLFIGGVILFTIVVLIFDFIWNLRHKAPATDAPRPVKTLSSAAMATGIVLALFVGAVMGATGIGGGVLVIPVLLLCFGLSAGRAVGSAILIGVVLSLLTALVFARSGQTDYVKALVMAAGSLLGIRLGSRLSAKLPEKTLKGILIGILFVATVLMLCN